MGTEELDAPGRLVTAQRATVKASPAPATGGPETGARFCIEPGSPLARRRGARIADLVVRTPDGGQRLNTTPTELTLL